MYHTDTPYVIRKIRRFPAVSLTPDDDLIVENLSVSLSKSQVKPPPSSSSSSEDSGTKCSEFDIGKAVKYIATTREGINARC